eukprot:233694-Hanusia_phi.AAC.1
MHFRSSPSRAYARANAQWDARAGARPARGKGGLSKKEFHGSSGSQHGAPRKRGGVDDGHLHSQS